MQLYPLEKQQANAALKDEVKAEVKKLKDQAKNVKKKIKDKFFDCGGCIKNGINT